MHALREGTWILGGLGVWKEMTKSRGANKTSYSVITLQLHDTVVIFHKHRSHYSATSRIQFIYHFVASKLSCGSFDWVLVSAAPDCGSRNMALNPTLVPLQSLHHLGKDSSQPEQISVLPYYITYDWWKQDIGKITTHSEQFFKFPFRDTWLIHKIIGRWLQHLELHVRLPNLLHIMLVFHWWSCFSSWWCNNIVQFPRSYNHLLSRHICFKSLRYPFFCSVISLIIPLF